MVRFIIRRSSCNKRHDYFIYIPIWLDLLCFVISSYSSCESDLHSNMVRFIILIQRKQKIKFQNLHSNMVRFIIGIRFRRPNEEYKFTFQYGQIYYRLLKSLLKMKIKIYIPIWLDLLLETKQNKQVYQLNLHSNMVRFIISILVKGQPGSWKFTFQYGQIYYEQVNGSWRRSRSIYIPIWLDLLSYCLPIPLLTKRKFTFQYGQIYYILEN